MDRLLTDFHAHEINRRLGQRIDHNPFQIHIPEKNDWRISMKTHIMEPDMSHPATTPTDSPNSLRGKVLKGCVLLTGIGAFFYFDLGQYLSLDALKANRDT